MRHGELSHYLPDILSDAIPTRAPGRQEGCIKFPPFPGAKLVLAKHKKLFKGKKPAEPFWALLLAENRCLFPCSLMFHTQVGLCQLLCWSFSPPGVLPVGFLLAWVFLAFCCCHRWPLLRGMGTAGWGSRWPGECFTDGCLPQEDWIMGESILVSSRSCGSCLKVVLGSRFHPHGRVGVFVNSARAWESGVLSSRKEKVRWKPCWRQNVLL